MSERVRDPTISFQLYLPPFTVVCLVPQNVQDCKIFVGGLEMDTNNDSMRTYFEQFGETSDVIVMRDGATKKSRGFGFVIFMDPSSVTECLKVSSHMLDGKAVSGLSVLSVVWLVHYSPICAAIIIINHSDFDKGHLVWCALNRN